MKKFVIGFILFLVSSSALAGGPVLACQDALTGHLKVNIYYDEHRNLVGNVHYLYYYAEGFGSSQSIASGPVFEKDGTFYHWVKHKMSQEFIIHYKGKKVLPGEDARLVLPWKKNVISLKCETKPF